jgi:prefoldin subunit 5
MISNEESNSLSAPNNMKVPLVDKLTNNSRKMPTILFIEHVEDYCDKYGAELIIEELNVYYSKYKYMEAQIVKHTEGVKGKIPDIEKAIECVEYLNKKKSEENQEPMKADFMVSNNLWAKAEVPVSETVCLWLGADVMCEYNLDEAKVLLAKNLENATTTFKNNENDLDFIKDQITVCEVNIARVYNENVKRNKAKK